MSVVKIFGISFGRAPKPVEAGMNFPAAMGHDALAEIVIKSARCRLRAHRSRISH